MNTTTRNALFNRRQALKIGGSSLAALFLAACGGDEVNEEGMGGEMMNVDAEMKIAEWEAQGIVTPNEPAEWGEKIAGHYPIATINEGVISVVVPHPMSEEHYIAGIYVRDEAGALVGFQELSPTDAPEASFEVTDEGGEFTIYAYCNLHDVWPAPLVRDANRPGPWADKVGSHTPIAELTEEGVVVTTPHPMTDTHYIVALYLTDQNGAMIDKVQLNPTMNPEATHTFTLPEGVTSVTPWSLCDDHDLWIGETIDVV